MSYLPQTKYGDCSRCGENGVQCKKRGKYLVCLTCCSREDTEKQIFKAKQRNVLQRESGKIRKLYTPLTDNEVGSLQSLVNDLDIAFSNYIRLKFANADGIVTCFVCDKPFFWRKLDCGHYISRSNKQTRFLEQNCYPQCRWCNGVHNENPQPFKEAIERYKSGTTAYLEEIAADRSAYKYDQDELKMMLLNYRQKVKLLESKLLIKQK